MEETPIFTRGQKTMCLFYSLLFGEGCCGSRTWNTRCGNGTVRTGCGCLAQYNAANGLGNCGCNAVRMGSESASQSGVSVNSGCNCAGNLSRCGCWEGSSYNQNMCAMSGCCTNSTNCCSGFGRHGGESVCGDVCYYCRQYALCRGCGCNGNV